LLSSGKCKLPNLTQHITLARYEGQFDEFCQAQGEFFDEQVKRLLAEHWGEGFTDFKLVKRDYSIVYSVTLKDG